MSLLNPQEINTSGLKPQLVAASPDGDQIQNAPRVILVATNVGASARNITVKAVKTQTAKEGFGLLQKRDRVVECPAGATVLIGPFAQQAFEDIDGLVDISYDDAADLFVGAAQLKSFSGDGDEDTGNEFCPVIRLYSYFPATPDLSISIANNILNAINVAGGSQFSIYIPVNVLFVVGSNIIPVEMTVRNLTQRDTNVGAGIAIASTDLVGGGVPPGVLALLGTNTGANNASLLDFDSNVLDSGFDIPAEYNLMVWADGTGNQVGYLDDVGNSGNLAAAGIGSGSSALFLQVVYSQLAGAEIEIKLNMGSEEFVNTPPSGFIRHCDAQQGSFPYAFVDFSQSGNVTKANDDRELILTNDISQNPDEPSYTGSLVSSAAYPYEFAAEGNVFEIEILQRDVGTLNDLLRLGPDGFLTTQISIDLRSSFAAERFVIDFFSQNFGDGDQQSRIASNVEFVAGDAIAMIIYPNGSFPYAQTPPDVQFIIKRGSTVIIYDRLTLPPTTLGFISYNAIVQFFTQNNSPDGNVGRVQFNGKEADYLIDSYPDGVRDAFGDPMPSKTQPQVKVLQYEALTFNTNDDATILIENSGKRFNVTNGGIGNTLTYAHSSIYMRMNSGIRVVECQVNTIPAVGAETVFMTLASLTRDSSSISIALNGGDLVLQTQTLGGPLVTSVIEASYTAAAGDILTIEVDTTLNTGVVNGFLYDGTLKPAASTLTYDNTVEDAKWMFSNGYGQLGTNEQAIIDSHLQAGDVSANTKPGLSVGAMDLLDNLI